MANYGGPDPNAFRELMNALRAQGAVVSDTIDKLGDIGADLVTKYKTKRREQGIDVTDEAVLAGLDWKGKKVDPTTGKSIGTRITLWEANRLGLEDRAKLLSLAKRRREAKRLGDYDEIKFFGDTIKSRGEGIGGDSQALTLTPGLYGDLADVAPSSFPAPLAAEPVDYLQSGNNVDSLSSGTREFVNESTYIQ